MWLYLPYAHDYPVFKLLLSFCHSPWFVRMALIFGALKITKDTNSHLRKTPVVPALLLTKPYPSNGWLLRSTPATRSLT